MIKVTYKQFKYNDHERETEIFQVLSFIYSEKDGYVAVCRRLFQRTRLVHKQMSENDSKLRLQTEIDEIGSIVVIKLEHLKVITNSDEDEKDKHLRELQKLLFQNISG